MALFRLSLPIRLPCHLCFPWLKVATSYSQVGPSSLQSVEQHLLALGGAGAVGQSGMGTREPLC